MKSIHEFRMTDPGPGPDDGRALPEVLGAFSIGLGLAETLAPKLLARAIGVRPSRTAAWTLRAFGLRELAAGVGVLMRPRRARPMWMRVAGDAVDLAAMALALRTSKHRGMLAVAIGAVAGVTALDLFAAKQLAADEDAAGAPEPLIFSVTINRPPAEVYRTFRKLSDLPRFMTWLESVDEDGVRSHWIANLPAGGTIGWEAELVQDMPGERISWRTVEGSPFAHEGEVSFAQRPGGPGTEVRVKLTVAGSALLAKLLTKPQIKGDLRRFKQIMETGELVFSDANTHVKPYPAQPSPEGTAYARDHAARSQLGVSVRRRATSANGHSKQGGVS